MQVNFKFEPLQKVTIVAYGLHYDGLVIRCEYDGHTKNYNVEFAADGKILRETFFEEQLR